MRKWRRAITGTPSTKISWIRSNAASPEFVFVDEFGPATQQPDAASLQAVSLELHPLLCPEDSNPSVDNREMITGSRHPCGRILPSRSGSPRWGFTLVELLIVIAIIAVLAGLVVGSVRVAQKTTEETEATWTIAALHQGLEQYSFDEGQYPAARKEPDPDRNDFPDLWRALMDRRNPYLKSVDRERIAVLEGNTYRRATWEELGETAVDKYLLDPWNSPYVYRCNKYHQPADWMRVETGVDLYSLGPDGEDDTVFPEMRKNGDDVY